MTHNTINMAKREALRVGMIEYEPAVLVPLDADGQRAHIDILKLTK
jgi:hypothetical protein